jgi:hypothetical protein
MGFNSGLKGLRQLSGTQTEVIYYVMRAYLVITAFEFNSEVKPSKLQFRNKLKLGLLRSGSPGENHDSTLVCLSTDIPSQGSEVYKTHIINN